jgi:hypothetical protein
MGISNPIINPLALKTKGECVSDCQNKALLQQAVTETVSCAKSGHKSTWLRPAGGCGRCVPCIFRRASLHAGGLDTEPYGRDVCLGEVDLADRRLFANDLRAVVSFLRNGYRVEDIEILLLANGGLEPAEAHAYADVVRRAMREVEDWLKTKGNATVRQWL